MEQTLETESIRADSEQLSREFKTLINGDDLNSINQLQHLIMGRLQDSNAVLSLSMSIQSIALLSSLEIFPVPIHEIRP